MAPRALIQILSRPQRPVFVPIIIAINIGVFFLWFMSATKDPSFMINNFLVSWQGLEQGRIWTLITSVFSHNLFWHLFINMYVLQGFGTLLENVLGSKFFIGFYLVAGVVSSVAHTVVSAFVMGSPDLPALGASGSISGIVLLFSLMFPREKILIFGLIPIPALFGSLAFVGMDLWGLAEQARGGGLPIGHGAHLGGALTGVLVYFFIIRKRWKSRVVSKIY